MTEAPPRAWVLCAGEGSRMRPLTANTPKPLLPVAGKPFLVHTLGALRAAGIEEVGILIGWRGRRIKEILGGGSSLGLHLTYVEQAEREGTAAAVGLARDFAKGDFLCLNGDVLVSPGDVAGLVAHGRAHGPTMAVASVERPEHLGVVQVKDGRVGAIEEKPARAEGNLVNAGVYYLPGEIFDFVDATPRSRRGEFEVTDTLRMLMAKRELQAFPLTNWFTVEYPWDLLRANAMLLADLQGRVEGEVEPMATLRGPVVVGKGSVVRNGAYVLGPTIIGEGCDIGPNCYIRPSTYLGNQTKVGNGCEVKNSIVMDHSHVPHLNYVGDSVLGERCNLGAGTKVANLRLDERSIVATVKGRPVDTGLRKLGAILGDDVKTGINASIDVGSIVGEDSFIGPGAVVRGALAPHSRVY